MITVLRNELNINIWQTGPYTYSQIHILMFHRRIILRVVVRVDQTIGEIGSTVRETPHILQTMDIMMTAQINNIQVHLPELLAKLVTVQDHLPLDLVAPLYRSTNGNVTLVTGLRRVV